MKVRPKKFLGQHFLRNDAIAEKIALGLTGHGNYKKLLEIGPGTGVLTKFLVCQDFELVLVELDRDSVHYLKENFEEQHFNLIQGDFIKEFHFENGSDWGIIGNFPYNISSQIFFKIYENRSKVQEVVCMVQKEVAERIASGSGTKKYGILSVLLQAFYDIDYLFTVEPGAFTPPPKVRSGVIRLKRNKISQLECDENLFKKVIKQGFQNRRKTLRNALKAFNLPQSPKLDQMLEKRAEQLDVPDFVQLTKEIQSQ
jgi:16S rRNA (adenine1518-N6/adenine1519-N6)-dimethyltransferase